MISWSVVKILVIVFQLLCLMLLLYFLIFEILLCQFVFADGFLAGVMSKSMSAYNNDQFSSLRLYSIITIFTSFKDSFK